ncbi:arabinoxylan arabinofuranohydrolase [Paenibacillus polymyxa M1]|nr:arabinoxylan arabinofuranohydrolase [Paenibacillus polymyxa M1]
MGPFTYKGHFLKNPYTFFGVGGTYAGKISAPFDGVALYANAEYASYSQYFANSMHNISVRGASI